MAIIRSIRKINPLDANKNVLTIGVALPLNAQNMFVGTPTTRQQVKTNLLNLILTEQGERLMNPDYGMGVKNLLFEQNLDLESLKSQIHNQILFFIPEVELILSPCSVSIKLSRFVFTCSLVVGVPWNRLFRFKGKATPIVTTFLLESKAFILLTDRTIAICYFYFFFNIAPIKSL